jgi:hypothetical protein
MSEIEAQRRQLDAYLRVIQPAVGDTVNVSVHFRKVRPDPLCISRNQLAPRFLGSALEPLTVKGKEAVRVSAART